MFTLPNIRKNNFRMVVLMEKKEKKDYVVLNVNYL